MSYGDVQMVEEKAVRFIVEQEALTQTVSRILADVS
mgnify:CR=1 FL=1